jgi:hypothetical protein
MSISAESDSEHSRKIAQKSKEAMEDELFGKDPASWADKYLSGDVRMICATIPNIREHKGLEDVKKELAKILLRLPIESHRIRCIFALVQGNYQVAVHSEATFQAQGTRKNSGSWECVTLLNFNDDSEICEMRTLMDFGGFDDLVQGTQ